MSDTSADEESSLVRVYRERIGEPATTDEATGYWLFAAGLVLGVVGILLFLPSTSASSLRQIAIVLAAAGLALVFAGPLIRLPLRALATRLVYAGLVICLIGIVYFVVIYPSGWNPQSGQATVMAVYALGLLVMGIGGVIVPILSTGAEQRARLDAQERELGTKDREMGERQTRLDAQAEELSALREALADAAVDEDDLSHRIRDLTEQVKASESGRLTAEQEHEDSERELTALREALADAAADEDDLSHRIRDLTEQVKASESGRLTAEQEHEYSERELNEIRDALAAANADADDLQLLIARLREETVLTEQDLRDAEADEADLAVQLAVLRTSQARFELYEDRGGEWRWRLRHRNGNNIASSGEGYTRRVDAQRGLQSVRRNALGAEILLIEDEGELPEEDETFDPPTETESRASFETYEDNAGEHRWRLRHRNGNILADSGEGYSSKRGRDTGIDRVRAYALEADYLHFDPTGFEVYRDAAGEYRWRLVHKNGNILADSGESYTRRHDARRAVDRIQADVDDLTFEVYEDNAGEHRWRALGGNDRILADSGEGYSSKSGANDAVERVQRHAPEADTLDAGRAAFEIFEDKSGQFRWRLRHRNGNIIADCGESYSSRSSVYDAIESVKHNAPNAGSEAEADESD